MPRSTVPAADSSSTTSAPRTAPTSTANGWRPIVASTTATSSRSARSTSASRHPDPPRSPHNPAAMPDSVLDILKLVLLVMLYLFFARVLFAVWSEVRQPANARGQIEQPPLMPVPQTPMAERRDVKPMKGRGGVPARLVVL